MNYSLTLFIHRVCMLIERNAEHFRLMFQANTVINYAVTFSLQSDYFFISQGVKGYIFFEIYEFVWEIVFHKYLSPFIVSLSYRQLFELPIPLLVINALCDIQLQRSDQPSMNNVFSTSSIFTITFNVIVSTSLDLF